MTARIVPRSIGGHPGAGPQPGSIPAAPRPRETPMRPVATALLSAALALPLAAAAQEQVVRIYNWSDYIDPAILEDFTRETGIRVVYDVYDSNELLEARLLAGASGYDLVVPTGTFLARQIQAGVYAPLDTSRLENWGELDPELMERVAKYDPGNAHAFIYMWGTTGFSYNREMIEERMPDAPVESWRMLLDPEIVSRFADCGVYMLDAPDEAIPAALNYLGLDPDSKDPDEIEQAGAVLQAVRPFIRKFHSSETINALANGDICLAMIWSGDAGIAATRADEAGQGVELDYVIPSEGAQLWFDMMAMPADAPHQDAAYAFMDYILRPEVIAQATNYVTYPNAVPASLEFVDAEIKGDPNVYPPDEVRERLFSKTPWDQRVQRFVTRLWTTITTGG
jgi:putrescine transport system substrate-binding protein